MEMPRQECAIDLFGISYDGTEPGIMFAAMRLGWVFLRWHRQIHLLWSRPNVQTDGFVWFFEPMRLSYLSTIFFSRPRRRHIRPIDPALKKGRCILWHERITI
jgi:hypothetical protein